MYNYYANLFRKLKLSTNITYTYTPTYKKADGTIKNNVMLVSSEVVGTKPIYKMEMQDKFFREVLKQWEYQL